MLQLLDNFHNKRPTVYNINTGHEINNFMLPEIRFRNSTSSLTIKVYLYCLVNVQLSNSRGKIAIK